jgi:phosphoribosylformylglycinamidine synthase subunit PurQ / glutaminase
MKSAVIVFPGTNRERDIAEAVEQASGKRPSMIWHGDTDLPNVDLLVVPGGFAYGDYLRAGAMAAHSPVLREVVKRAQSGTPTLGVCNGFQVLTEAGLLPGALLRNAGLKFICKDVHLKVGRTDTFFTGGYALNQVIRVPVAHHDGNYFADGDTLDQLDAEGRVAFHYCTAEGDLTAAGNPNGSARNIAGIYNKARSILGMMPHPENAIRNAQGSTDGAAMFAGIAASLASGS